MSATSPKDPQHITHLLQRVDHGDDAALGELMPMVYDRLRGIAHAMLAEQRADHTLQPTALVHDAYLKMVRAGSEYEHRTHFYCVAAKAMRQVLTDHARGRGRQKRGGDWQRVTLSLYDAGDTTRHVDLVALDEALTELEKVQPDYARVVELRFFTGMSIDEIAAATRTSRSTVKSHWRTARAWLRVRLDAEDT